MIGEHRIRVRLRDGKKSTYGKVKSQLGTDLHVHDAADGCEFVICAASPERIERVRSALVAAGLEEIQGSTDVAPATPARSSRGPQREQARTSAAQPGRSASAPQQPGQPDLRKKPYAFVPLPDSFLAEEPVWHDGTCSAGRLSGEVRFAMENLRPLLVGWERQKIVDEEADNPWRIPSAPDNSHDLDAFVQSASRQLHPDADDPRRQKDVERTRRDYVERMKGQVINIPGVGRTIQSKSILYPLRAPWGDRSVILPGDSLKGLLRHELGALLGAPMERVAERWYSYRPNLKYPDSATNRRLEPRLARIESRGVIHLNGEDYPVPLRMSVLEMATRDEQSYYPRRASGQVVNPTNGAEPYRGGMAGGRRLPDEVLASDARRRVIHTHLDIGKLAVELPNVPLQSSVLEQYRRTLEQLLSKDYGHFSTRHPQVGNDARVQDQGIDAVRKAAEGAFRPGDLIWVEWDTKKRQIVSFGWHYYYRWAYQDTVRLKGWTAEREGLYPLADEKGDQPARLSPVRRLFGYTCDNEKSTGNYAQLMGRISINAALEIVPSNAKDEDRFLPPTFLRELGMPRPSAVEFYLQQPYYPNPRPSDRAKLVTYGDAAGYDEPGRLSGRKFYLDRRDAYTGTPWPWEDGRESNRLNNRSTLALEASQPGSRFRFTLRFRDLDPWELADALLALCPHQFSGIVGGNHADGYCSKLGYARPLGWGSVRIEAKEMCLLKNGNDAPKLEIEPDVRAWFKQNFQKPPLLEQWLGVHRCKHPNAGDYPTSPKDRQIYTFHTDLRAEHTRLRRYDRGKSS
jgi:hypothetical protein